MGETNDAWAMAARAVERRVDGPFVNGFKLRDWKFSPNGNLQMRRGRGPPFIWLVSVNGAIVAFPWFASWLWLWMVGCY